MSEGLEVVAEDSSGHIPHSMVTQRGALYQL